MNEEKQPLFDVDDVDNDFVKLQPKEMKELNFQYAPMEVDVEAMSTWIPVVVSTEEK